MTLKEGDYLLFNVKFHLLSVDIVLEPGTMFEIMKVEFREHRSLLSEEVDCFVVIAVPTKGRLRFIKLDYGFHADKTSIIPDGKARNLLFKK